MVCIFFCVYTGCLKKVHVDFLKFKLFASCFVNLTTQSQELCDGPLSAEVDSLIHKVIYKWKINTVSDGINFPFVYDLVY